MKFLNTYILLMAGLLLAHQPMDAGWQDKISALSTNSVKTAGQSIDYLWQKITHHPKLALACAIGTIATISFVKYIKQTIYTPSALPNNTLKIPSTEDIAYNNNVVAETKEIIAQIRTIIGQSMIQKTKINLPSYFEGTYSYYKAMILQGTNNMIDYRLWRKDKKTNRIFYIREQANTIIEYRFG